MVRSSDAMYGWRMGEGAGSWRGAPGRDAGRLGAGTVADWGDAGAGAAAEGCWPVRAFLAADCLLRLRRDWLGMRKLPLVCYLALGWDFS